MTYVLYVCNVWMEDAERVEELAERERESVWSVVRQQNVREDQREGVRESGNTGSGIRGRDM